MRSSNLVKDIPAVVVSAEGVCLPPLLLSFTVFTSGLYVHVETKEGKFDIYLSDISVCAVEVL